MNENLLKCWCGEEHFHREYTGQLISFSNFINESFDLQDPPEHAILTCDCDREILARLIRAESRLYEWNCPECGLMRDTDA